MIIGSSVPLALRAWHEWAFDGRVDADGSTLSTWLHLDTDAGCRDGISRCTIWAWYPLRLDTGLLPVVGRRDPVMRHERLP